MIIATITLCWLLSLTMSSLTFVLAQGAFQKFIIPAKDSLDLAEKQFAKNVSGAKGYLLGFALSKGLTILAFAGLTATYYLGMVDHVVKAYG